MLAPESTFWICLGKCANWLLEIQDSRNRLSEWGDAEHAIKAFASLRKVIGGVSTEKGIREYLTLLSICKTCQYKGVSFLDFLRSGEKNIDVFMKRGLRGSKEAGFTSR